MGVFLSPRALGYSQTPVLRSITPNWGIDQPKFFCKWVWLLLVDLWSSVSNHVNFPHVSFHCPVELHNTSLSVAALTIRRYVRVRIDSFVACCDNHTSKLKTGRLSAYIPVISNWLTAWKPQQSSKPVSTHGPEMHTYLFEQTCKCVCRCSSVKSLFPADCEYNYLLGALNTKSCFHTTFIHVMVPVCLWRIPFSSVSCNYILESVSILFSHLRITILIVCGRFLVMRVMLCWLLYHYIIYLALH